MSKQHDDRRRQQIVVVKYSCTLASVDGVPFVQERERNLYMQLLHPAGHLYEIRRTVLFSAFSFNILELRFTRCFIPNTYAGLASAVGPVLLLLMSVGLVFTQAYLVTPQWKHYDDIFRGHYNIRGNFAL